MATGKYGSASAWLLNNGINMIPFKLKSLSHKTSSEIEDVSAIGESWREFLPVGVGKAEFRVGEGIWDTTATTGDHAVYSGGIATSPQATPRLVCFGFSGNVLGEDFFGYEGALQSSYEALAQVGALTKANAEFAVTGRFERGQIIQPLATKTGDWNTDTLNTEWDNTLTTSQRVIPITSNSQDNPTVVTTPVPHGLTSGDIILISGVATSSPTINGERTVTVISTTTFSVAVDTSAGAAGTGGSFVKANSIGGGVGWLQVTAFSGFTDTVIKLRDSADNSTYADWATFTTITGVTSERVAVAGTLDRYFIVDGNVDGTGSITAFVGVVRLGQQ